MKFIEKLDIIADLDQMRKDLFDTLSKVSWPEKKFEHNGRAYHANQIGLTYRSESDYPWFDASGSLYDKDQKHFTGTENDFTEWNDVGEYTRTAIESLGIKTGRIRYMRLMPKMGLSVHPDFEFRYHYVLETNKYSYFGEALNDEDIAAKCYHLPANGHFYKVDTTREHFVFNGGWAPRIHLVICEAQ